MKIEYEYLRFVEKPRPAGRKTGIYSCRNLKSDTELGLVRWHGPWRQYCYFPIGQAIYSAGCLQDIADFISRLPLHFPKPKKRRMKDESIEG